ncbi:MAG: glycosyltransferase family 2 protein [Saprospiraceae bacterium]|nr:glycosyltransferase family 2 protein [Saprospiraceae bacterium]
MNIYTLELIFWIGLLIVFYAYLGYGIVLWAMVALKRMLFRARPLADAPLPEVTFIVCAYNEEDWIEQKIANSLAIDYPSERIQFYFATDGSNDRTEALVRHYPYPASTRWMLLHEPERRGKIAAFQRAMQYVSTPVVVSTDANTLVNPGAVRLMVQHFADPGVGAVAGEKRIVMGEKADAGSAGEGIYWQYESLLKKWDAELWSVVGAAGELFAFRTEAYEHVPLDTIVEDFYLTMRIAQKGWRVQYEPEAYAVETSSASVAEEMKRKVRIAAGGLQAVVRLVPLLNIFRYGVLTFQYVSHRVLRWTLAPLLLPILFMVNTSLAMRGFPLYQVLLAAQTVFYIAAFAGYVLEARRLKVKAFFIPYYFCIMNYSMYAGLWRLLRGRQSVLWERAMRA